ncbi:MAG TPA: DUF6624 domain-containing protein [Thermoanaerobaculia bacterium]|jgi:hypothetical protein
MDELLRDELIEMRAEDWRVRAELAVDGSLYDGYNPRMEEIHRRNAARLSAILDEHGWPGISLVGQDGAEAAWLIAQHAISVPDLQRRALWFLREASARGEAKAEHWARLEDRVRVHEGRAQLFGTQFDWDEQGLMSPLPIEDVPGVEARRRAVGLPPLGETVRRQRASVAATREEPPLDWDARQRRFEQWARATGWREM